MCPATINRTWTAPNSCRTYLNSQPKMTASAKCNPSNIGSSKDSHCLPNVHGVCQSHEQCHQRGTTLEWVEHVFRQHELQCWWKRLALQGHLCSLCDAPLQRKQAEKNHVHECTHTCKFAHISKKIETLQPVGTENKKKWNWLVDHIVVIWNIAFIFKKSTVFCFAFANAWQQEQFQWHCCC